MTRPGENGYSLIALMAGITMTLIAMGVAVPSWQHVMQDDREQELLFRGGEIADSIARFQKKNGGAAPVSLEVLVKGRFLRKQYKDPMTKDGQWRFLRQGEALGPGGIPAPGTGTATTTTTTTTTVPRQPSSLGATGPLGGFIGVASRDKRKSLRVMNGAKTYDTWLFIAGRPRVIGKMRTVGPGIPGMPGGPGAPGLPGSPRPLSPISPSSPPSQP
jgi:type II secretory pathway pseudopilin PulG